MAATLMQFRRLVRSRLGIPITDDFMPDRVLDDHINLAVQTLSSEARWPWDDAVETVTINTTTPDIPTPVHWRATRAVLHGESELQLLSPIDILQWLDTTGGIPQVWCPIGDAITVRPTPGNDVALVHYYYTQSPWLRDDEDTPTVPEQYGGAIVAKAAELLAARESDGGGATRNGAEYTQWVARMRRETRRSTTPTRTRVRPGGWI
jgi:hypothetical protein